MNQPPQKMFEDKFPNHNGARCPLCAHPIIETPNMSVVYACTGCNRSFVRENDSMITIETYLDPDQIFQFDCTDGLSPSYQKLLIEEERASFQKQPFGNLGISVQMLEEFRGWADLGFVCLQQQKLEETIYCMAKALHDFYWNSGFWLNIAQMSANLWMFDMAERAIAIVQKMEPNYEALPRIKARIHAFHNEWKLKNNKLPNAVKRGNVLQRISEDALRHRNYRRALIRMKQAIFVDSTNQMVWTNIGSLSLQNGDPNTSKEAFEKAISLDPNNANAHYQYMNYFLLIDDFQTALKEVSIALKLDPSNSRYQAKFYELESKTKQPSFIQKQYKLPVRNNHSVIQQNARYKEMYRSPRYNTPNSTANPTIKSNNYIEPTSQGKTPVYFQKLKWYHDKSIYGLILLLISPFLFLFQSAFWGIVIAIGAIIFGVKSTKSIERMSKFVKYAGFFVFLTEFVIYFSILISQNQ